MNKSDLIGWLHRPRTQRHGLTVCDNRQCVRTGEDEKRVALNLCPPSWLFSRTSRQFPVMWYGIRRSVAVRVQAQSAL